MRRILDVHCHIYPNAIAKKAAKAIGDFYSFSMAMDGTVHSLLTAKREAQISRCVVHSAAVVPDYVEHINEFLIRTVSEHPNEFIGFGTLHPEYNRIEQELDRLLAAGMKGIKLHPDFQLFYLDDPKAILLYRMAAERNLPILFHIGDPVHPYSSPIRMAKALDQVPKLRAICAHLGGWSCWKEGWTYLAGQENVWIDTCSSLFKLTPEEGAEIIHRYGADRTFFGTDYPMWNPSEELERFMKLPLSDLERDQILYQNLKTFLGIEEL